MKFLRLVLGISLRDRMRNGSIRQCLDTENVVEDTKETGKNISKG
jgi:hypothetical protein